MLKIGDILWVFEYSEDTNTWKYHILEIEDIRYLDIRPKIFLKCCPIIGTYKNIVLPICDNYCGLVSHMLSYYTTNEKIACNFIRTHNIDG